MTKSVNKTSKAVIIAGIATAALLVFALGSVSIPSAFAQGNPGPKPVIRQGSLAVSKTGLLTGQSTVTQQGTVFNVKISGSATGTETQVCHNPNSNGDRTLTGTFTATGVANPPYVSVTSGQHFGFQLKPTSVTLCNNIETATSTSVVFSSPTATIDSYSTTS